MALVRIVAVATTNDFKVKETKRALEPYGIYVLKIDPQVHPLDFFETNREELAVRCNKPKDSRIKPLYVLREQTALYSIVHPETSVHRLPMLAPCVHVSDLCVTESDGGQFNYHARVDGYIDRTRRRIDRNHYDWDDVFVVARLGKTYLELEEFDHKVSARDQVLSQFIKDKFHYKVPRALHYEQLQISGGINHRIDPYVFLAMVPEYNLDRPLLISNIPKAAVNVGFFFRGAENRRQALYWSPGSNAGLPLVAKPKDPMHEKVFMFHDLSHFCIPDLVFTPAMSGTDQDLHRQVYIMYRLLSEAITLVLADMIMVDACERSGFKYDTKLKRKIFPVFELLKHSAEDCSNPDKVEQLLWGSAEYCFWHDMSVWKSMMDPSLFWKSMTELDEFCNKYDTYFEEDLKWTIFNYKDMNNDAAHRATWWTEIREFVPTLYSVEEWIRRFDIHADHPRRLLRHVFDSIMIAYIRPLLEDPVVVHSPVRRFQRTFSSYMSFQMRIFYKFEALDPSLRTLYIEPLKNGIRAFRESSWQDLSEAHEAATCVRDFYDSALRDLASKLLISNDDVSVYTHVYPLFQPKIIDYDHKTSDETIRASTYFNIET